MKSITILGAGESGIGAALLAKEKKIRAFVSDCNIINEKYKKILIENDIEFEEGKHSLNKILKSYEVVKSPGIPNNSEIIKKINSYNINIISELDFGFRYANVPIIAITGSNGKSTVASLLHHILQNHKKTSLCGNIGNSFCREIIKNHYDIYIIEVSSFQLEDIKEFKPDIAIITNISEDHLDRYNHDINKYADAKFKILINMTSIDNVIIPNDDILINNRIDNYNIKKHKIIKQEDSTNVNIFNDLFLSMKDMHIKGYHNILNIQLASKAAEIVGLNSKKIIKSLETFKVIKHRLEFIANINGINFYNDSKATNIGSVKAALESFEDPIIWLAGGKDKGNDYKKIKKLVDKKVKALICIGKNNNSLKDIFKDKFIFETENMKKAVNYAYNIGKTGDNILLSPGCSSFDIYNNFEERGNIFINEVNSL
ncbi:MAG: UDP-N-acetylmuramoyl-L-alanine--D-glutamate ligase [Bacteroidetes bacterium]|nr:UDP-N-acetylmuramoyl-L-alanine--D-glutamate ligase [Bacteroidota bacterium]